MCKCTPNIRTPFCGKPGCEWPKEETAITDRVNLLQRPPFGKMVETRSFAGGRLVSTKSEYTRSFEVNGAFEALSVIGKALTELGDTNNHQMTFAVFGDHQTADITRVALTYAIAGGDSHVG